MARQSGLAGRAAYTSVYDYDWIAELARREQKRSTTEDFSGKYEFKVTATCPPTTAIHIRGGRAWAPTDDTYPGRGWTVPSLTVDFADAEGVWGGYAWTNAYYYAGSVVTLGGGYNPDYVADGYEIISWFTTWPTTTERATAAEAEDDCLDILWDAGNRPWDGTIPLCFLIFRNNGVLGEEFSGFQPIDAANRGRSYIWQDCRPRGLWVVGDL